MKEVVKVKVFAPNILLVFALDWRLSVPGSRISQSIIHVEASSCSGLFGCKFSFPIAAGGSRSKDERHLSFDDVFEIYTIDCHKPFCGFVLSTPWLSYSFLFRVIVFDVLWRLSGGTGGCPNHVNCQAG